MREPAVAGQFYADNQRELSQELKFAFSQSGMPKACKNENKILTAVAPHAGYAYSGMAAAYAYKALAEDRKPKNIIIIGPNHTGTGAPVAIYPEGEWRTPMGSVRINNKISEKLSKGPLMLDERAHEYEHSAEVQIPLLQYVYNHEFSIVPICAMDQSLELMQELGGMLAKVLNPKTDIVIASTDFSHYVPQEQAYENDMRAISEIKNLDAEALYDTLEEYDISMCGPGGVVAAMTYAKLNGAKGAELLKYMTSGDTTGDKSAVVGYGSLVMV